MSWLTKRFWAMPKKFFCWAGMSSPASMLAFTASIVLAGFFLTSALRRTAMFWASEAVFFRA